MSLCLYLSLSAVFLSVTPSPLLYVGETRQALRSRMSQHRYDARYPKYRTLYSHFNQPGHDRCLTMKIRIIEKIYHHTNSPIHSTPYHTDRELFWIKELGTAMPYGCNDNIKGVGHLSSPKSLRSLR